jgi:hypothetical protein
MFETTMKEIRDPEYPETWKLQARALGARRKSFADSAAAAAGIMRPADSSPRLSPTAA